MNYKYGKWAKEIIDLQHDDGTWGRGFHTLSQPTKENPITTEQALRRLMVLGYTLEDVPIRKAVDCMTACLRGERKLMIIRRKSMIGRYLRNLCFQHGLKYSIQKMK